MGKISLVTPLMRVNRGHRNRNWKVVHGHLKRFFSSDLEWIVAEQGSTAASRHGINRIPAYGDRNRSEMRNIGWKAASNDMICFLDGDLVMRPSSWEKAFQECWKWDVYSPYRRGSKLGETQTKNRVDKILSGDWTFSLPRHRRWNLCGGICFIRRHVLEQVHGWDERFWGFGYEDIAMEKLCKHFSWHADQEHPVHLFHGSSRRRGKKAMRKLYRKLYSLKSFDDIVSSKIAFEAAQKATTVAGPRITAVLSVFGRPGNFEQQVAAVESQSIPPNEILVWQNHFPGADFKKKGTWASCSENLGVWSRFAFALNARSEYVCVFDDDTIPGSKWFENCVKTMEECNGLLGTAGVVFKSPESYYPCDFYGWRMPSDISHQVDIVGHAWFFRREWLAHYWADLPGPNHDRLCGEDIHFSYVLQKQGIKTYVPPHPIDDRDQWGSLHGMLGAIGPALSTSPDTHKRIQGVVPVYVKKGFSLICQQSTSQESHDQEVPGPSTLLA